MSWWGARSLGLLSLGAIALLGVSEPYATAASVPPACGWSAPELATIGSPATLSGASDGTSWLIGTNELDAITAMHRVSGQWQSVPDVIDYQAPNSLYRPTVTGTAAVSGGGDWVAATVPTLDQLGDATAATTVAHVWRSTGASFTDVTPAGLAGLSGAFTTGIAATSDNSVWLAASASTFEPLLFHWDGAAWTDLSSTLIGLDSYASLIAPTGTDSALILTSGNGPAQQARMITGSTFTDVPVPAIPAGYIGMLISAVTPGPNGTVWASAFGDRAIGETPFAAVFSIAEPAWTLTSLPYPIIDPTPTNPHPPGTVALSIAVASSSDAWIGGQTTTELNQPDNPRTWHFDGSDWTEGSPEPEGDVAADVTDPEAGTPLALTLPYYSGDQDRTLRISPSNCTTALVPPADMPETTTPAALLGVGAVVTVVRLRRRRRTTRSQKLVRS